MSLKKLFAILVVLSIITMLPVMAEDKTGDEKLKFTLMEIFDNYNNLLLQKDLEGSLKYMDKKANEEFKAFTEEDKMLMIEFAAFTVPSEYDVKGIKLEDGKAIMSILGYFKGFEDELEKGTGEVIFVDEEGTWKIHEISVDVGDGTIGD